MDKKEWVKDILTWEQFGSSLNILLSRIPKNKYKYIFGIPRGGLIIAVWLSHQLKLPLIHQMFPHSEILIVDDIADTGKTLKVFEAWDTATLYYKPRSEIIPTYYAVETSDWIVFPYERVDEPENREP